MAVVGFRACEIACQFEAALTIDQQDKFAAERARRRCFCKEDRQPPWSEIAFALFLFERAAILPVADPPLTLGG